MKAVPSRVTISFHLSKKESVYVDSVSSSVVLAASNAMKARKKMLDEIKKEEGK